MRKAWQTVSQRRVHLALTAWSRAGRPETNASKMAQEGTESMWGRTEEKAVCKASFLSRGLASRAGNDRKEMAGAEELEPRVTEERVGGLVVAVMAALENLTMVNG